ncbi:hypothetical protein [Paraburkholderia lacunae]|uniref:hypothetical protein n=1 Tax=Paraburkholderia lacunae TaxID=2211104 RepID=UPI001058B400|nr:hypothetical protein [Paraburkholderia lacunae]
MTQRSAVAHGEPLPCRAETLALTLQREGFSFRRNRYSLKKRATKRQPDNYRRDVALSGITSIFVEEFCTPDSTLCGRFAAQLWPLSDHGGSVHAWRDLFALHDGVRSPQAQDGTTDVMLPTPSSAKTLLSR